MGAGDKTESDSTYLSGLDFVSAPDHSTFCPDLQQPTYYTGPLPEYDIMNAAVVTDGTLDLPGLSSMLPSGFGTRYDEVFELSDTDDDDFGPLDVEEYRRIAIECASSSVLPRRGDDYDEGAGEDEDRDGVHEGDCRLGTMGEAVHWKSQAERYFSECTQLRAMVMALRETFDEVEEENEEMHCALSMAHREILNLNYHLDVKQLETETLMANFEAAVDEMDSSCDVKLDDLLAAAEAHAQSNVNRREAGSGADRERTDWKQKAAQRFAVTKESASSHSRQVKESARNQAAGRKLKGAASGALSGFRAAKTKLASQPAVKELMTKVEDSASPGGRGRFSRLRGGRTQTQRPRCSSPPCVVEVPPIE